MRNDLWNSEYTTHTKRPILKNIPRCCRWFSFPTSWFLASILKRLPGWVMLSTVEPLIISRRLKTNNDWNHHLPSQSALCLIDRFLLVSSFVEDTMSELSTKKEQLMYTKKLPNWIFTIRSCFCTTHLHMYLGDESKLNPDYLGCQLVLCLLNENHISNQRSTYIYNYIYIYISSKPLYFELSWKHRMESPKKRYYYETVKLGTTFLMKTMLS